MNHVQPGWLLGPPLLHGWTLVGVNSFFYAYFCWLGFWFIRGTAGQERFFIVGWSAGFLLWPLEMLRPQWATITRQIGIFGLAVALLAAVAMLLELSAPTESGGSNS